MLDLVRGSSGPPPCERRFDTKLMFQPYPQAILVTVASCDRHHDLCVEYCRRGTVMVPRKIPTLGPLTHNSTPF